MPLPQAGAPVEASDWSDVFPVGVDAWTPYTPTLTQTNAVTKTVTHASYVKIGRLVVVNMLLTVTGSGTAAAQLRVGLPLSAGAAVVQGVGAGLVFDTSTGSVFSGTCVVDTVDTFKISFFGGIGFTAALASGDLISAFCAYEAAA